MESDTKNHTSSKLQERDEKEEAPRVRLDKTLPVPTLALTEAGVSDRFYAGWFSHSVFSLIRRAVVINTG